MSADWLTPGVPAEAVAALGSAVESSASALADCLPVDLLGLMGPWQGGGGGPWTWNTKNCTIFKGIVVAMAANK